MAQEPKTAAETEDAAMRAAAEEILKLTSSAGWKFLMAQLALDAANAQNELVYIDETDPVQRLQKFDSIQGRIKRLQWFEQAPQEMMAQGFETENLPTEDEEYPDE